MNSQTETISQPESQVTKSSGKWRRWMLVLASVPFCLAGYVISLGLNEQTYGIIRDSQLDLPAWARRTYAAYRVLGWVILFASLAQTALVLLCLKEKYRVGVRGRRTSRKWAIAATVGLAVLLALTIGWANGMMPTVQLIQALRSPN